MWCDYLNSHEEWNKQSLVNFGCSNWIVSFNVPNGNGQIIRLHLFGFSTAFCFNLPQHFLSCRRLSVCILFMGSHLVLASTTGLFQAVPLCPATHLWLGVVWRIGWVKVEKREFAVLVWQQKRPAPLSKCSRVMLGALMPRPVTNHFATVSLSQAIHQTPSTSAQVGLSGRI